MGKWPPSTPMVAVGGTVSYLTSNDAAPSLVFPAASLTTPEFTLTVNAATADVGVRSSWYFPVATQRKLPAVPTVPTPVTRVQRILLWNFL